MSDEYAASGYQGSLVNPSGPQAAPTADYDTANYPADGDTTSSGGYGAGTSSFSRDAQRGRPDAERAAAAADPTADMGLVQQSTSGGDLSAQAQDAQQGRDAQGQVAYGESLDSRADAERVLADGARGRRDEGSESGPAGDAEQDVGA